MTTRARREREKEERRKSILHAAREIFLQNGYYQATVGRIAERAQVSKGTIYLYFESKEAILACLLLEGLDVLVAHLDEATAPDTSLDAPERLRRLGRAYCQFFQQEPLYFRFLMAAGGDRFRATVTPPAYEEVLQASMRGLGLAVRTIEQGIADEQFRRCDARQAAATLWAALNGVLELMSHPLRRELVGVETEALYQTALETVIRGLQR